ncbi:MAG: hypothetical protein BWK78_06805 [Thiotrichaceae bacterium IS1]|nr:MAG: hypothetical protein BWK78_06805 [Thiotrichaceae bacterium IS1]
MKITLFTPSSHQVYKNIKRSNKRQPTLGPAYLMATLLDKGHQVTYLDGDALDLVQTNAVVEILKTDSQVVGISLTTPLFSETRDVARLLRQSGYRGHITLGGAHPTYLPEESLKLIPEANSVVMGEGDNTIVALANTIEKGGNLEEIRGIAYRTNHLDKDIIVVNQHAELVRNLDDLPLPALEYYPLDRYKSPMWTEGEYLKMGVLITSRGCPFQCEFCASGAESLITFRFHSVKRVLVEIKRLVEKFKVDYLVFNDDTFTVNKKRCIEICNCMKKEGISTPFMVTSRVNTVSYELLKTLKEVGCFLITYGIESGSPEILKEIGKKISLEQARLAVKWAQDLGIKVVGNFMFGHWHDTVETCQQTLDFALALDCDISQFAITIPYPGSVLHRRALAENRIFPTEDYNDFGYYGNMPWKHPNLSSEELIAFQKEAYRLTQKV